MKRICVAIGVIALLLLAGCKGKQLLPVQPTVSQETKNNFEMLVASYPDWESFSAKGDVSASLGAGSSLSASTQVKMIRSEVVQISVRVVLGIEVARVVITPDSVFVLNKLKRQYYTESLEVVGSKLTTSLSLETIQDALLGRIFLLDSKRDKYSLSDFEVEENVGEQWQLTPRKQDVRFLYRFELQGINLLTTWAGALTSDKALVCRYDNFVNQGGNKNFPTQMSLSLEGVSTSLSLDLHYTPSSILWDESVKIDNLNLSKYTQVSASQILKM